jgi:hypothetical protein
MTEITEQELRGLYDYETENTLISDKLAEAVQEPVALLRFLARYVAWNGYFGSSVASLAGKIGRSRRLFLDRDEPITALADRSVFVGSYFFDAARDEFDDRDTAHRDTHRCLAQAMTSGVLDYTRQHGGSAATAALGDAARVNALFEKPVWLDALCERVKTGYGAASSDDLPAIFRAMGYHLGSEVLADQEFSVLDQTLRKRSAELVHHLERSTARIAGQDHKCYQWLGIHSGHGGGVEADHFAWASQGAKLAFRFVPEAQHAALREQLHRGFLDFAHDHREFFESVNRP